MNEQELAEIQQESSRIFTGKILNLRVDQVLLPNGSTATREIVEHNGAVCIVPITEDRTVYMVRQYRYPFGETMLEIPAGKLDGDELPAVAANRELEEEIGMRAAELTYLGELRPSVAYLTERIHVYLARGLTPTKQHLDEDEFLNIETHSLDSLTEQILAGQITDAKTIAALLTVKLKFYTNNN